MRSLLPRAILAFVLLPGLVAYVAPLALAADDGLPPFRWSGLVPLAAGTALLLWCAHAFYAAGRGTLAPWTPPERLVTTGPYRFSRNPMYVAVLLVVCGWSLAFRSRTIAIYAAGLGVAFHLRIVFGEEPWLARTHGEAWTAYRMRVRRWLGAFSR